MEPTLGVVCYKTNYKTDESQVLEQKTLLSLPTEVIEEILLNCTYAEISEIRLVCKGLNKVCQSLLNKGFHEVVRYENQYSLELKARLPQRESERRNHALARHWDILSAIKKQMSLLSMTYSEYIELRLCCFIPGKVIDEFYYVLRYLKSTESPPEVHELLRELRDISSMARENFNEKIVPGLKKSILKRETPSQLYSISVTMAESSSNNGNMNELLMKRVQTHPELWNQLSPNYKDTVMKRNAWKAISQELGLSCKECKAKWESLSEAYRRAKRAKTNEIGGASTYVNTNTEEELSFLQPSTISNTTDLNFDINSEQQPDSIGSVELEPPENFASVNGSDLENRQPQRTEKRKISTPKHENAKSGKFDTFEAESDADEMFLLSCLPTLKRFNNKQKAAAKLKINQVLYEIEFASEE